ncbi:MAG TPA: hypothetical protein PLA12_01475 [Candidatus Hydrogenedens sp.]|nr:hypothetical protein [Candidatus Hydrogenedens sp.]
MFRNVMFLLICVIISSSIFADGVLTISDVETATPGVFRLPLNWEGNQSNISTLIIRWNSTVSNIFPLEVEPSSNLGAEKKLMYSVTGSQINIIIYGGTQSIPDGLLGNLVAQSTTRLADNSEIQITGVTAEGADNKALPKNVLVNGGKIIVKNNNDFHSADTNKDWSISLSEVLRVVQLFNAREYHCEAGTEDGYAPFEGNKNCTPHKSDYDPQDWKIRLNELLRIIQFFNFPGGSYHPDTNGEDKYSPGPFSKK